MNIKTWQERLEEAAHFTAEDYENDKVGFMADEITELRAEVTRLKQQEPAGEMVRNWGIGGGAFANWGVEPPIGAKLYLAAGARP